MTRNPFDELEQLFDRMEAQFEGRTAIGGSRTDVDLLDAGEAYHVEVELPGFDPEDLELTYADGRLFVDAEREETTEVEDDATYVRRERSTEVERTVSIPEGVDEDGIEASFDQGVLTITLPKLDPDEGGRQIEIE